MTSAAFLTARKVGNFHVPTNLAGYRHVYRAHIDDPDIQDARAHFPFVCIGDNHEFSWQGWQSFIKYGGKIEPAQPLRVAANQAWWEYIPSRVRKASGPGLDQFGPPAVATAPIDTFDDHGFGTEANNRTAVGSMTAYRALRYGKHVDLILTDFHSYTMRIPTERPEADAFDFGRLPGGSAGVDGDPRRRARTMPAAIPPRRSPSATRRAQFPQGRARLHRARPRAESVAQGAADAVDRDLEDLGRDQRHARHADRSAEPARRAGEGQPWPGKDFGTFGGGDFSGAFSERAEIYDTRPRPQTVGLRHHLGRPPQLLGRLCRAQVCRQPGSTRSG